MTYQKQTTWKEIMKKLPADYQFTDTYQPVEEWWDYKGIACIWTRLEIQKPLLRLLPLTA
ncbi:TPA: hypothetical protein ACGOS7_000379 [Streptococcus suis]|uniref:hypothetical protein n=1 Tax=Streptococcus sp. A23 TaxID=3373127 RepID=UPI003708F1DC